MAHKRHLMLVGALVCLGVCGAPAFAQAAPASPTPPAEQAGPAPGQALPSGPAPDQLAPAQPAPAGAPGLKAARAALDAGQLEEAQTLYEDAVAAQYQDPEAHFGLGLTLYALGDLNGARFEFGQLTKIAPQRFEGYYNLGVVAARAQQHDDALADYAKALDLARGQANGEVTLQVLNALAGEQARKGDFAALSATLQEALKLSPNDAALKLRLASATFAAGNGPDALPLAYAALQAQPQHSDAALLIAEIYVAQQLPERALRELDKAIWATTSDAERAALLEREADVQIAQGQIQEAIASLRGSTQLNPAGASAWAKLGEQLFARDRGASVIAWQSAVAEAPNNALYRTNLASARLALGAFGPAREAAELAARDAADPATAARAEFVEGVAAYRQGDYAAAVRALQSSALKTPSAESSLWLGLSAYAMKDFAGADAALEASVKADPAVGTRAALGAALLASGRYPEAEATLRGVVVDAPKNAEAWYNLGWSLRGQGRENEAKPAFKTALGLGYAKAREALR